MGQWLKKEVACGTVRTEVSWVLWEALELEQPHRIVPLEAVVDLLQ